jgi:hypothetical protein
MHQELFVVAESMEEIENRKVPLLVGIERWRKNNAVRNRAREEFAGDGVALDAAGGSVGGKSEYEQNQNGDRNATRATHSGGRRRD